jgi:8-oxo-dGTP pyrophosphatase MutT (NUDIX family)
MSCKFCPSQASHICRNCDAINVHRTSECDGLGPRCTLNCGVCSFGATHYCKKCGAKNIHRSNECDGLGPRCLLPKAEKQLAKQDENGDSKSPYDKPRSIKGSYSIVGIILVTKFRGVICCLIQKRCASLNGKYCFPGGSYDSTDATYFDGALRELKEESGFDITYENWRYLGHIAYGKAINFVIHVDTHAWANRSPHSWEVQECDIGIQACHGHSWVIESDLSKLSRDNCCVISFLADLRKIMRAL